LSTNEFHPQILQSTCLEENPEYFQLTYRSFSQISQILQVILFESI